MTLVVRLRVLAVLVLALAGCSVAEAGAVFVSRPFSKFGTVDLTTGLYTEIGTTTVQLNALSRATDGTLFGLGSDNTLYRVNTGNAGLTAVGPTGTFFALNSIASRTDGALFGEDPFGSLFSVSTTTGTGTLIGSTGVFGLRPTGTLAFGAGDTLFTIIGDFLYTQNQSTGAATLVGPGPLGISFPGGLVFTDGQLQAFNFFGAIYTINTSTGIATPTGVNVIGGFGQILGAAPATTAAVPAPGALALLTIGLTVQGGVMLLRRRWGRP
jgi:hypothetical protein